MRSRALLPMTLAAAGTWLLLLAAGMPPGYPVNDAGAYQRMVELWIAAGQPIFIGWNEMTLLGHLGSGVLARTCGATGIGGLQLLVGFEACLISALLCWLAARHGWRGSHAALSGIVWLLSPVAILSSTSFMTEVPFALWTTGWLCSFTGWARNYRWSAGLGWAAAAVAAFSVRQNAVVLPLAAAVGCLLLPPPQRLRGWLLAASAIVADGFLWWYRSTIELATIRPLSAFWSDGSLLETGWSVTHHMAEAVATVALFALPLAAAGLAARSGRRLVTRSAVAAAAVATAVLALAGSSFPFWGNIITTAGPLPDVLPPHSGLAPVLATPIWLGLTVLAVASLGLIAGGTDWRRLRTDPGALACGAALAAALALAALPSTPFDRYLAPVMPLTVGFVILTSIGTARERRWHWPAIAVVAIWAALSVLPIRHLHRRQQALWQVAESCVTAAVPASAIDGGFEWNMWHQPVPFDQRGPRLPATRPWYQSYPFTRLEPEVRLWIGTPPAGWRKRSSRPIPGGFEVLVLVKEEGKGDASSAAGSAIPAAGGRSRAAASGG